MTVSIVTLWLTVAKAIETEAKIPPETVTAREPNCHGITIVFDRIVGAHQKVLLCLSGHR